VLGVCLAGLLAYVAADRNASAWAGAGIPPSAGAPIAGDGTDLITEGGWECLPRTRVDDGKLVIDGRESGLSRLNDYRLRLETGPDVAISLTVEAETPTGLAGLSFWNSLPPPGDATNWYSTAAKLVLGRAGDRVQFQVFDGTGTRPAFQYNGRGQSGPLPLSVQRSGDTLVFRVADAEVARTKVLGPLTGGPLYFGPAVNQGQTLTVHRLAVTDQAHPNGVEVVHAVAPARPTAAPFTLRAAAAARGKLIGANLNQRMLRWDQAARDLAAREFNIVTAGDAFTWRQLRPSRDEYKFCGGDRLVEFAAANNLRVHAGHLTWHQDPEWLTDGKFSRDELIAILKEHIQTVVGHFRGRVHAWNVVNEVFEFNNSGRLAKGEEQLWMRVIGPEYIDMAFRWAHEADPQAILIFNSADDEGTGCAARCGAGNTGGRNLKADALYEFVKGMKARGVPIHAVGMQMHLGAQVSSPTVDPATIAAQMKRLGDLGLDVWITEMDVPLQKPVTPAKLAAQAQTYRQVFEACLGAQSCKAFIVWGVDDGNYAEPPALARRGSSQQGQWAAALLFDAAFRPKPAYNALADVLRRR
jgi:endo-1,4-beta-xylanase